MLKKVLNCKSAKKHGNQDSPFFLAKMVTCNFMIQYSSQCQQVWEKLFYSCLAFGYDHWWDLNVGLHRLWMSSRREVVLSLNNFGHRKIYSILQSKIWNKQGCKSSRNTIKQLSYSDRCFVCTHACLKSIYSFGPKNILQPRWSGMLLQWLQWTFQLLLWISNSIKFTN